VTPSSPPLAGGRGAAFAVYKGLIALFAAGSVLMFFLAGAGAFGAKNQGYEDSGSFDAHAVLGTVLSVIALLALIAVALARPGLRLLEFTGLLVVLMIVQNILGATGSSAHWITGALHPIGGLLVTGLAFHLATRALGGLPRRGSTRSNTPVA
jgi:hypothetical protein